MQTFLPRITRRDLIFATVSVAITVVIVTGFLIENRWGYAEPGPRIIYVESWAEDRPRELAAIEGAAREAERQRNIAQFEVERAEALLRRAPEGPRRTAAEAQLEVRRAELARRERAFAASRERVAQVQAADPSPATVPALASE